MKEVSSILDFGDGGVIRKMNDGIREIMRNIADSETDCKTRSLVVKIKVTPSEQDRDNLAITSTVEAKLRPKEEVKVGVQLEFDEDTQDITIKEKMAVIDGQIDSEGCEHESKYIKV